MPAETGSPDKAPLDTNSGKRSKGKSSAANAKQEPPSVQNTDQKKGLFDGWTGKTPVSLLSEHCRKQGWAQPIYDMKRTAKGFQSAVKLCKPDKKTGQLMQLRWIPDDRACYGAPNEARHMTATYALHRVNPTTPLYRVLPPVHRDYWRSLDEQRKQENTNRDEWRYASDPFVADQRHQQTVLAQRKQREDAAVAREQGHERPVQTPQPTKWPEVNMGVHCRGQVETVIQKYTNLLTKASSGAGPGHTAGHRSALKRTLVRMGFRERYVDEALQLCSTQQEALDWLCLHVPEDDIPEHFLNRNYRPEVTLMKHTSSTLGHQYMVDRMVKAGFPRTICQTAFDNSGHDLALAYYQVVQAWARLPTLGSTDEVVGPSEWRALLNDECVALEAIYQQGFKRPSDNTISVSFPLDLPEGLLTGTAKGNRANTQQLTLTLEAYFPAKLAYPTQAPVFVAVCEELPAYLKLHLTRNINRSVQQEFLGDCMVFSLVEYSREHVPQWLASPPSLTELMAAISIGHSGGKTETSSLNGPPSLVEASIDVLYQKAETSTSSRRSPATSRSRKIPLSAWRDFAEELRLTQDKPTYRRFLAVRQNLPAWNYQDKILAALQYHQVLVVSGATGCGKTTQVPQFILDACLSHYTQSSDTPLPCQGRIVCTQPRRISAIGVAQRVAQERNQSVGGVVGYTVRGQSMTKPHTCLQFCTTGVLLRVLQSDPQLTGTGCVIVDEVHERSVDNDFLLILLREVLAHRKDLKVILMSATLETGPLLSYFNVRQVLTIPGFTYPVQQVYPEDLFDQITASKPSSPPPFPSGYKGTFKRTLSEKQQADVAPYLDHGLDAAACLALRQLDVCNQQGNVDYEWIARLVVHIDQTADHKDHAILIFLTGVAEITRCIHTIQKHAQETSGNPLDIYPLHAGLTPQEQNRVFSRTSGKHSRKVVVATNVAETSITIDDVVYVIDSGRVKEVQYDSATGMTRLVETWASRAACQQRQGRAGRTQPGVCYKLFSRHSESVQMLAHQPPELLRMSLEQLCLQIKALGKSDVVNFLDQAPTPPDLTVIENALELLRDMSLLDSTSDTLTSLGHHVAKFPADLHIGKLLVFGSLFGCLDTALTIGAMLSLGRYFVVPHDQRDEFRALRKQYNDHQSDLLTDARIINAWEALHRNSGSKREAMLFAERHFLSKTALFELRTLKASFFDTLRQLGFISSQVVDWTDERTNAHCHSAPLVKAVLLAGLYPNVVHVPLPNQKYGKVLGGTVQLEAEAKKLRYFSRSGERVFLHPTSLLFDCNKIPSQFVTYYSKVATTKVYLRDANVVSLYALLFFGGTVEVDHQRQLLHIGPWVRMRAWPRIGVLVNSLRKLVDQLLRVKLDNAAAVISDHPVLNMVMHLIENNGV
ncbi:putative ATP-dependent RNA helicase ucp12 [Dispira simplex]|nr:putative ATP-dependent RNA helicase ucp12 [Dispira simplex]